MEHQAKILDLGYGTRNRPSAIGLDINPLFKADVINDLSNFPTPSGVTAPFVVAG